MCDWSATPKSLDFDFIVPQLMSLNQQGQPVYL